uniref:Phosphopantetheine adenylyltransferase n=1 Tax=Magnetococcus massalia (strain MO-1) TaxID=451514 RepID=A0A1S7LFN5_MAGMO|nr:Phosphopantetheine adenylyltransferase [Candidatus Magnetococcus massalia]
MSETCQIRTAIYPGSFDPVTLGHLDIIQRSRRLFEKLIVGVAVNTSKKTLFTIDERVALLHEVLRRYDNVEVQPLEGLLVHSAQKFGANAIIRGLRAVTDFDYEFQMGAMNRHLAPQVETLFLMADESNTFLSSSLIKEVARMGGDFAPFVPPEVVPAVRAKLNAQSSLG